MSKKIAIIGTAISSSKKLFEIYTGVAGEKMLQENLNLYNEENKNNMLNSAFKTIPKTIKDGKQKRRERRKLERLNKIK